MGCAPSDHTSRLRRIQNNNLKTNVHPNPISSMSYSNLEEKKIANNTLFDTLLNGVSKIASPANMMPSVCLSRDSFPIVTSFLHIDDSTPSEIQLPIITCSQKNGAKIVCFSQISFLQNLYLRTADTQKLVTNVINWVSGWRHPTFPMTKILLIGFGRQIAGQTLKCLQDLGYLTELYTGSQSFAHYSCIILLSDFTDITKITPELHKFVENGGGILVFYIHSYAFEVPVPINSFLTRYGLAYTFCILNENIENSQVQNVPNQYATVRNNNLVLLAAQFKSIIKQTSIDTSSLDDIITMLRYYVMVADDNYIDILQDIYKNSWDYLKESNYASSEGICPDVKHGMIIILIQELIPKFPVEIYTPIKEHEIFPGKTGDVTLASYSIEVNILPGMWCTTGLWLPAGVIGTVEISCDHPIDGIMIQIGSHYTSLLTKQEALKRWPNVVSYFSMTSESIKVGTFFGGIVYVTCTKEIEVERLSMTFHQFCEYPRVVVGSPEVWENTKSIPVPWGELETTNCIFTLPTEEIKKLENFDLIDEKFKMITDEIAKFMSCDRGFPYRFIFDIEQNEDSMNGEYPLIFGINEISDILNSWDKPSETLGIAMSVMSVMSLREDCFDQITEIALAAVSTANALAKVFDGFDPLAYSDVEYPKLFPELWNIHSKCSDTIFPEMLKEFQDPQYKLPETPDDMWVCFVKELCRIGQRDFTTVLDRARPIPLNISISLRGFPIYQSD